MVRHPNLDWAVEEKYLRDNPKAIQTLRLMEESGGEPDLLQLDSGELIFCDCSQESPALRRSLVARGTKYERCGLAFLQDRIGC